jgi:hypothetical protein
MNTPQVSLRSVNSLLTERFFIPSYQRGYRWTDIEVNDLLDDLWEFQAQSNKMETSGFYCLQPVVIKKRPDGSLEVVDGQQRLTTIYLILMYHSQKVQVLFEKTPFSLSFATRSETSEKFLKNIDPTLAHKYVDFYHISIAYAAIDKWFKDRDGSQTTRMLQTLLNDDTVGRNVKVIWYELPGNQEPVEAFTRLNIGKIPLTNSELIRALFLRSGNFNSTDIEIQQLRIAQEWDSIEKALQKNDFWYFIHSGQNTPDNRIEYLFELMVDEAQPDNPKDGDDLRSFHYYSKLLSAPGVQADKEWLKLKQLFMMLDEWFHDRALYHLTGLLIHMGVSVPELRQEALTLPKSAFDKCLRTRIFVKLFGSVELYKEEVLEMVIGQKLSDLDYRGSKQMLRSVLLLFNIATLLENVRSNLRFPFDSFKQEAWDIEHISSVDSDKPDRTDSQKVWLRGILQCSSEIQSDTSWEPKIKELLESAPFDKKGFDVFYDHVLDTFGEKESTEADNRIENLTLLDQATNRSYKNAVFPVKRHRILSLDRSGTFVPLCTRNIFLKCYSKRLHEMLLWNKGDKNDYLQQITTTFVKFFSAAPNA